MQFSNDNLTWSTPEAYTTTKSWVLDSGDGTKTVCAKFKDVTGSWSNAVSDTINLTGVSQEKERVYIYCNGQRIAMEENGVKYFFHNDHLGSTSVVSDEAAQAVKRIEYAPFGEVKSEEGSLSVAKKFTGKKLDDSTGLYDYAARQYDARLERFISADPIEFSETGIKYAGGENLWAFLANPQNLNRYSYCLNNPLRYIDPDGLLTILIHGTFSNPDSFNEDFIDAVRKTFDEQRMVLSFDWSGKNVNQARVDAAKSLASLINKYNFAEGEKLNMIGYSHGGNVAFLASQEKLTHKIDNLVTLGTPIREYKPNMNNITNLFTAYSAFDKIQANWGGGSSTLPFIGEIGSASRGIDKYGIPIGERDEGSLGTHSNLVDVNKWRKFIDPAVRGKDRQ